MPLSFRVVRKIELPDEPGEWIEVRMPSLTILDKARAANSRKAFETMAGIDPSMLQGLRSVAEETNRTATDDFDWQTLLTSCILAWSYEEPVTPENIIELTPDVVQALLAELLPNPSPDERKKGSVHSMNHSKVKAQQ